MSNEKFTPIIRFAVMSDIHLSDDPTPERDRFHKGIADAYRIAQESPDYKSLDALVIVGDFATSGTEIQMQCAKNIIDEEIKPGTKLIISIASHEYHLSDEGVAPATEKLARIFSVPPDVHEIINGFHFVSVSPSRRCDFNKEKQQWVYENLEEAKKDDPLKPVFMFQHPHVTNTVNGSIRWGCHHLVPAYMDHPQILVFSGHSHAPINDPRAVYQQHFTCFGTGTLSYLELDEYDKVTGTKPASGNPAAQMLIVEADAQNRVRVYPYDILTSNFFPRVWTVDVPSDPDTYIYTDKKRCEEALPPYFTEDAQAIVSDITSCGAKITFPQAVDDKEGYVNSYDILLRRKSDHVIVSQKSVWSDYFVYHMPETREFSFDHLESDTVYIGRITANGFFNNTSSNYLDVEFKTK